MQMKLSDGSFQSFEVVNVVFSHLANSHGSEVFFLLPFCPVSLTYVYKCVVYLYGIVSSELFSCSGACVQIPGASLQCGVVAEGDE